MTDDPDAILAQLALLEKAALLSGANVWQTRGIPRLAVPPIWLSDGPHGLRRQRGDADHLGLGEAEPAVCFPTAATVANSWDESLAERLGAALGEAAAASDVDVLLGPGMNIVRSPRGGRSFEYFSEDPELTGRLAAAYVRGVQRQGVAATPKHFAVNSQELRRLTSDSVVDERTLREIYLTAFEIVVREAAPWALMSSYNLVCGIHAHENRHLLTAILRDDWGFDGAVVSDWGGTSDPVAAVSAGGTLEMPSPGFGSVRAIVTAVERGSLAEAEVDARVAELLRLVQRVRRRRPPRARAAAVEAEHHALAREAAAAGTVLLRNTDGILPLAPGMRVALVGAYAVAPRYQGAGSSIVTPTRLTTLEGAAAGAGVTVTGFAPGYRIDGRPDAAARRDAVALARGADVVVLALAIPAADESEGIDRPHLRLPAAQVDTLQAVARTGVPVVVVVSGGGPVEMPWRQDVSAIVHGFLGGQAAGEAMWDVLTGRAIPGGRLAVTIPEREADTATAGAFPATGRRAAYDEGVFVGYRHHATHGPAPAYPFGFGLGYTDVDYDALTVSDAGAAFVVRNVGLTDAAEVAQLYVRRISPSCVPRPDIELKAFATLRLRPGEEAAVWLPFGERTFRFWDVRTDRWEIEGGEYEILVGRHSEDLPLRSRLDVAGATASPFDAGGAGAGEPTESVAERSPDADGWHPPFDAETPLDALDGSPSALVRSAVAMLTRRKARAEAAPEPDLDVQFLYTAPLRIVHQMTRATPEVTAAVVDIANGHPLRGAFRAIAAAVRGRRSEARTRRGFERAARGATVRR